MIKHTMGETCVPLKPQRIVTLFTPTLATLLALGVKPIGTTITDSIDPSVYLADKMAGIELLGSAEQPNLEKILLLKPDLILTTSGENAYGKLSQIAPTVAFEWDGTGDWKKHLRDVAKAIGKTEEAEQLMADYEHRIQEFKVLMGDRLDQLQVSLVNPGNDFVNADVKNSFPGTILEDVGLHRPPKQDITAKAGMIQLSLETIPRLDGDVIFVYDWGDESDRTLDKLRRNPLWLQLDAVKQDKVYVVDNRFWRGSNILAANKVIDDLFRYLVEETTKTEASN